MEAHCVRCNRKRRVDGEFERVLSLCPSVPFRNKGWYFKHTTSRIGLRDVLCPHCISAILDKYLVNGLSE